MAFRRLQLYGTPLSHFTRKIRILLSELRVDYDFVRSPSVLSSAGAAYANNPLRRVPALVDGNASIYDSEHIARYIVNIHDPSDRLGVCSTRPDDLNRLAVANGVMDNEVTYLLTQRAGGDVSGAYFKKLAASANDGLAWLDANAASSSHFGWADIAAVCMWEHLEHTKVFELGPHSRLASKVSGLAARPSVAATSREVTLAEAAAAGWKPLRRRV